MVVDTALATSRLGTPRSTVERGTTSEDFGYVKRWNWACGCSGEFIGGTILEVVSCSSHAPGGRRSN